MPGEDATFAAAVGAPRTAVGKGGAAILGVMAVSGPQASAQAAIDVPVRLQLAQGSGAQAPRIAVISTVVAEPASRTPLQIRIAPTEAIPRNSFLQLRGLPPTASLSEGQAIAPGFLGGAARRPAEPRLATACDGLGSVRARHQPGGRGRHAAGGGARGSGHPAGAAVCRGRKGAAAAGLHRGSNAPALTPADRENAERLVARGERDLEQGNIALARQFFLRAAQAGLARGALLLAATYDPRELARMRAVGVQPNLAEARKWYERALELGAPKASERLATLGGGG